MIKYSRQREAIRKQISNRGDHPTAETLYAELKGDFPNLSFATVYRNLNQLVEQGEIAKINVGGATRFDYDPLPHSHFFCRKCGAVIDMPENDSAMLLAAHEGFSGIIEACTSNFYGICPECAAEAKKRSN